MFRKETGPGMWNRNVLSPNGPPPTPPDPPPQQLTREQLLPSTPSVMLENKKDAFSPRLQEFCLKNPIAVVRCLAGALKLGKLNILVILIKYKCFICITYF